MRNYTKWMILFLFTVIISSCKKNNPVADTPHISANIDGKPTTFNFHIIAISDVTPGSCMFSLSGNLADPLTSQTNLVFTIAGASPVTTGTYTENAGSYVVGMFYSLSIAPNVVVVANAFGSASHPVTITITSINATSVKGTFSGELSYIDGNGMQATTLLTGGSFYATF